jgi:4-azaleucine resistance transporter AzlC
LTRTATPATSPADSGPPPPGSIVEGARAILPLALGVFPFGLAYGVTVTESSIDDLVGVMSSFLVLAGAAQLAIVDLLDEGAPWFIVVGTALVINARFAMYSGALAPSFSEYPRRWRIGLTHLMTDQATVISLLYNEQERDPRKRMLFYAGAGGCFALSWFVGTILGVLVGAAVPSELQVGFAVPLMFVALLVPSVKDRPSLVAASVGFAVTLLAKDAPLNSGLLIGGGAGIAFGLLARLRWSGTDPGEVVGEASDG